MGGKRSISLRLTWKLTQQLSHSVLNTCWKFNWVWMQFEEFLLNELDFYLARKKKKRGNSEITPFLLKNYSTGVLKCIKHLLKVSLSLVAIWRNFIKWAGLLLRRKKKKKEEILNSLRSPRKLTQQESHSE